MEVFRPVVNERFAARWIVKLIGLVVYDQLKLTLVWLPLRGVFVKVKLVGAAGRAGTTTSASVA